MNSMTVHIELFYDSYENLYGDGFYPVTEKCNTCSSKAIIEFELDKNAFWKQTTYQSIKGLDGDQGEKVLQLIEKITEVKGLNSNGVKNIDGRILYAK